MADLLHYLKRAGDDDFSFSVPGLARFRVNAYRQRGSLAAVETGHLLIATLHTKGAANTIDRTVDAFPSTQQGQIRAQLSMVLRTVVSQQLLPGV